MDYKYQITVGMPVWGVEKFIKRSLLSVLEQDFEDMEIQNQDYTTASEYGLLGCQKQSA